MSKWSEEIRYLSKLLPDSEVNFRRLKQLLIGDEKSKIAVFGKFNHGKSTLLNTLLGYEHFSIADKRETIVVSEIEHDGKIWIDTPGLDADTSGGDDKLATDAVLEKADIICLVHNVKAGELDKSEMETYQRLMAFGDNYKSKFILVLTQIDQVAPDDLERVKSKIVGQIPNLFLNCVSATRYQRGINESKNGLITASGILPLLKSLESAEKNVQLLRKKEAKNLIKKIKDELNNESFKIESKLADTQYYLHETHLSFSDSLEQARNKYENYQSSL